MSVDTEKINSKYEILTDSGFKPFSGIKRQEVDNTLQLEFSDGSNLECTLSHKIKLNNGEFKYGFQLEIGDCTSTNKTIVAIKETNQSKYVYDILGVKDTQAYTTNNVESHNCAFVEDWDNFYKSVYPTISSGQETKVVFTSTPCGINHYYNLWEDAVKGKNAFIPIKVTWKDVPGRDEKWKAETIANTSQEAFIQEHEAEFIGSSGTLIDGWKLKELTLWESLTKNNFTSVYELPEQGAQYVVVCDVSRGKGIDNSAFVVIKVSSLPYKVVATYYCANIPPDMYAEVIYRAHKHYNEAFVVVENNDAGCETLRVLHDTYECETILGMQPPYGNIKTKTLAINGGSGFELGVRTTKSVKAVGCARLKTLVENNTLIFGDKNLIDELNRFSKKGNTYQAEEGAHDDIVMTTVLFSWLTTQDIFVSMTNIEVRRDIRDAYESRFEEELAPFGYIFNGLESFGNDGFIEDIDQTRHLLGRGNNINTPSYKEIYRMQNEAEDPTIFPLPNFGIDIQDN